MLVQGTINVGPMLDQGLDIDPILEDCFIYWSNVGPSLTEPCSNIGKEFQSFPEPWTNIG